MSLPKPTGILEESAINLVLLHRTLKWKKCTLQFKIPTDWGSNWIGLDGLQVGGHFVMASPTTDPRTPISIFHGPAVLL